MLTDFIMTSLERVCLKSFSSTSHLKLKSFLAVHSYYALYFVSWVVAAEDLKLWSFSSYTFHCCLSQWGIVTQCVPQSWPEPGSINNTDVKLLTNSVLSVRYRGAQIGLRVHGSCCVSRLSVPASLPGRITLVRTYSAHHQPDPPPPTNPARPDGKGGADEVKERALAALKVHEIPLLPDSNIMDKRNVFVTTLSPLEWF